MTGSGAVVADTEGSPDFTVEDSKTQWSTDTEVDIFKTTYVNEDGEVTVESSDGEKVIAPGTESDYTFFLKNTGNISLDYTLTLGSEFQAEDMQLPLEVRLRRGDSEYVAGSEEAWIKPEQLSEVYETGTLDVNRYAEYTLEWRWPFTDEDETLQAKTDENDTALGDASVMQDVDFKLQIMTQSEVTPNALPILDPSKTEVEVTPGAYSPLITEAPEKSDVTAEPSDKDGQTGTGQSASGTQGVQSGVKTGDDTPVLMYLILGACSGVGLIILILVVRRRRRGR
jgi:LPXTG-motif cell wall-anchored protein